MAEPTRVQFKDVRRLFAELALEACVLPEEERLSVVTGLGAAFACLERAEGGIDLPDNGGELPDEVFLAHAVGELGDPCRGNKAFVYFEVLAEALERLYWDGLPDVATFRKLTVVRDALRERRTAGNPMLARVVEGEG